MRTVLPFLLIFLIFSGCDGTYDNESTESEQVFSVSMAPAYAPGAATEPIPVNAQLILHASTALDPATVHENSIYIQNSSAQRQPATVTLVAQDIIIQPKVYLTPNTTFDIIITTEVTTTNGAHLTRNAVVSFTSGNPSPDTTAPTLIASLPKDLPNNIAHEPFTKIYFQFDEPISPLNIDNNTITVQATNYDINISGSVKVSGSLISFTPDQDIPGIDTNWNIFLNINDITDLAGNGPAVVTSVPNDINASFWSSVTLTPKPLGRNSYNLNTSVNCIESDANILFIGSNDGLHLIEFDSTTATFSPKSHLNQSSIGKVYSIDINSTAHRAYIGSSTGFSIINISNPSLPTIVSSYPTSYPVYGIDQHGAEVYLAASLQGFIILNITDETNLSDLSTVPTSGTAFDVLSFDNGSTNGVFLSDYDLGMRKYSFSGKLIDQYSSPTPHMRTLLSIPGANYIYIAAGIGGVYNVDTISTLTPFSLQQMPSYTTKIIADSTTIYTNDIGTGIGIISSANSSFDGYIPLDLDIVTMTGLRDANGFYLILADTTGQLYSMKVQ